MSPLSVPKLELSLYTHGPLVRLMKFQLSVCALETLSRARAAVRAREAAMVLESQSKWTRLRPVRFMHA